MILYSVIVRSSDGIILAEATSAGVEGNHPLVTQKLIEALLGNPSLVTKGNRKTFAHSGGSGRNDYQDEYFNEYGSEDADYYDDDYSHQSESNGRSSSFWGRMKSNRNKNNEISLESYFHVQRGENIYLICLSDDRDCRKQRANFGFLLYVQKEFTRMYTPNKIETANAYGYDKSFRKTYSNLMHHCNTNVTTLQTDPEINKMNAEIENIKQTLDTNIDLLTKREMKMEDLLETTEELLEDSQVFNQRSTKLKRVMKKKSLYYKLILIGFALFTIYLMMVKLCGFDLTCNADKNNSGGNNGGNNYGYGNNNHNNYGYGNNNNYYGN